VSAEIIGPFPDRRLVVDGWQVPLLQATEVDGGRISFVLDNRMGLEIEAKDFDKIAHFLADTVAVALGLPCHPRGDDLSREEQQRWWALLPHTSLAPSRVKEITGITSESDDQLEEGAR